jgi:hypothetical protein
MVDQRRQTPQLGNANLAQGKGQGDRSQFSSAWKQPHGHGWRSLLRRSVIGHRCGPRGDRPRKCLKAHLRQEFSKAGWFGQMAIDMVKVNLDQGLDDLDCVLGQQTEGLGSEAEMECTVMAEEAQVVELRSYGQMFAAIETDAEFWGEMDQVGPGGEEAIEGSDERSRINLGLRVKPRQGTDHNVTEVIGSWDATCQTRCLERGEVGAGGDVAQLEVGAVGDLEVGDLEGLAEVSQLF